MPELKCGNCRYCVYSNYRYFCNCFNREVENSDAKGCPNYTGW